MKKFLLLVLLAGCPDDDKAPPIKTGKCVVDEFQGPIATKQVCVYQGYNYACTVADCKRTGEATGERPK